MLKWPTLPTVLKDDPQSEVKKVLYQAQLDLIKADYEAREANEKAILDDVIEGKKRDLIANIERDTAAWLNEYTQAQAVNAAYLDVGKGAIERATTRANFVQAAATAISGAYVAVLGLSFAASKGTPLPARGVFPTIFLGLAIFLAAAYVSFLTRPGMVPELPARPLLSVNQKQRRNSFLVWSREITLQRRQFLQASVISLGIGVFLLPLPYLSVSGRLATILAGIGLICVVVLPKVLSQWLDLPSNIPTAH